MHIPHSYISRISNRDVLEAAGQKPYTQQLLAQQLILFGKVARAPDSDFSRSLTFCPGSMRPATSRYVRRVGRPRCEWATKLLEIALAKWGSSDRVQQLAQNPLIWKCEIHKHF